MLSPSLTCLNAESGILPALAGLLSPRPGPLPGLRSSRSNDTNVPRAGSSQAPLMLPRERPPVRVTTCLFNTCRMTHSQGDVRSRRLHHGCSTGAPTARGQLLLTVTRP